MSTVRPVSKSAPALLKVFSDKLRAWIRYREAIRQLSQLSDEELHDIGISRGEIEYVARH